MVDDEPRKVWLAPTFPIPSHVTGADAGDTSPTSSFCSMPAFCGSLHCEEAVEFADLLPHVAEYKSLCASQDSHLLSASGNRLGDLHVLMQKRAPTAAELQAHAETIAAHWDQPI